MKMRCIGLIKPSNRSHGTHTQLGLACIKTKFKNKCNIVFFNNFLPIHPTAPWEHPTRTPALEHLRRTCISRPTRVLDRCGGAFWSARVLGCAMHLYRVHTRTKCFGVLTWVHVPGLHYFEYIFMSDQQSSKSKSMDKEVEKLCEVARDSMSKQSGKDTVIAKQRDLGDN